MDVMKISAFSEGEKGGNPAGVVLFNGALPDRKVMQKTAATVGFSETVFAARESAENSWRVRYFSPETEVPFCGHATIALGAVLAKEESSGTYALNLNNAQISVTSSIEGGLYRAALQSPTTNSRLLTKDEISSTLNLFTYTTDQLDPLFQPAYINGGAGHYYFALKSRQDLREMEYDLENGKVFMRDNEICTIMFTYQEAGDLFHVRNAFASGGVLEDPATGAAAAAFSGYLRDIGVKPSGEIDLIQGEDMGQKSLIHCQFNAEQGSSITVSGFAREIE